MRARLARLAGMAAAVFLLALLSGCEDPEARLAAQAAKQQAAEMRQEVDRLRAELKAVDDKLPGLREGLVQEIASRMDKIGAGLMEMETKLRNDIMAAGKSNAEASRKQIEAFQMDSDGRLREAINVKVAEQIDALRKEIARNREELLGFMDRQLKELYPYAYQPRRLEEPGPPQPPQP
jgi:hypothetical protein